ncbi:MAG: acetyl-CoA carboxylase biotin carboxylase subunit, partial [Psychrobacter sp.]
QTRQQAVSKTLHALDELVIEGIKTNIPMHRDVILADDNFVHEAQNIHYLERELLTTNKEKS